MKVGLVDERTYYGLKIVESYGISELHHLW